MLDETTVHILGGGIGGTVGAVLTCPLEVVKVRLQSSRGTELRQATAAFHPPPTPPPEPTIDPSHHDQTAATHRKQRFSRRIIDSIYSKVGKSPTSSSVYRRRWNTFNQRAISPSIATTLVTNGSVRSTETSSTRSGGYILSALSKRFLLIRVISQIAHNEGIGALFKGLIPTLFGVLPSRGIYFCAYHKGQVFFERIFPSGSSGVYLCAAAAGSITASSLTNPIWFVKTRLQLDSRPGQPPITVGQVIRRTLRTDGIKGFYRGLSASYIGSLETAFNYVVYENLKGRLLLYERQRRRTVTAEVSDQAATLDSKELDLRGSRGGSKLDASSDMLYCMLASAMSKALAITATYPHEVIRTRLREETENYSGFVRTLRTVIQREGFVGLYRGMGTHYIRQVPNSCIMIGTYEFVVFLLDSWQLTRHD